MALVDWRLASLFLLALGAVCMATHERPIEVLYVYGCAASSSPRRTTSGCPLDGLGGATLTIRGRQFEFDSEVTLLQSTTLRPSAKQSLPSSPLSLKCALKHHSKQLPHQLIFCQLPAISMPEHRTALSLFGQTFDVQVVNFASGASGVLRRAVTFAKPPSEDASTSSTMDGIAEKVFASVDGDVWMSLGVGGLKKQFSELFRRAFASRLGGLGEMVVNSGLPHVKGVILHGPPGTGKTLIARTVAKLLHASNVHVVNGPEIINKFVGESEKNLRALFEAAELDYKRNKDAAGLHVLIFDEIDVLLRHRGKGGDEKGIYDGVTTQMLALMDGVNSCPNMLIIGLTNRLDALDKALLRPGRFEVQIRIPLPDHEGRKQIFSIHTKNLRAHRYLSPAVNFDVLARDTSSFSGADIAGVVRSATSFALERVVAARSSPKMQQGTEAEKEGTLGEQGPPTKGCGESSASFSSPSDRSAEFCAGSDLPENSKVMGSQENDASSSLPTKLLVLHEDFLRGIQEVVETKGFAANVAPFLSRGGVAKIPGDRGPALLRIQQLAEDLSRSSSLRRMRVLLHGPPGSGTTTIAALAARNSRFSFVNIITADSLAGLTVEEKILRISETFSTAAHVPQSFIILDGLENIVDATFGRPANDRILTEVLSILYRDPVLMPTTVTGSKTLVLITTSNEETAMQVTRLVDRVIKLSGHVPVFEVLNAYNIFGGDPVRTAKMASAVAPTCSLKRLLFLAQVAAARAGLDTAGTLSSSSSLLNSNQQESPPIPPPVPSQQFIEVLQEFGLYQTPRENGAKTTIGGHSVPPAL